MLLRRHHYCTCARFFELGMVRVSPCLPCCTGLAVPFVTCMCEGEVASGFEVIQCSIADRCRFQSERASYEHDSPDITWCDTEQYGGECQQCRCDGDGSDHPECYTGFLCGRCRDNYYRTGESRPTVSATAILRRWNGMVFAADID